MHIFNSFTNNRYSTFLSGNEINKPNHQISQDIMLFKFNNIKLKSILLRLFFLFLYGFQTILLQAQNSKIERHLESDDILSNAKLSQIFYTECSASLSQNLNSTPLLTNIKNLEKKQIFSKEIDSLKSNKTKSKLKNVQIEKLKKEYELNSDINLKVGTNFKANIFNGGAPPDNTLAISNNGNIVSVINCNVAYFNENGTQIWTGSFWELFNDPTLTEIIYDPIVLYDSQADRFVMIAIHGFSSKTSKLIISFSKTNNPRDGWWIYKLSGNPLNNTCWLDYPKLGISNNEIFITGNLFGDNTGYSESIIYQIGKSEGYSGKTLNWKIWSDIVGSPITLIPVNYGQQGNYGPGLYFVNQSPGRGNSVSLFEITNELNSNPRIIRNQIFKRDYEPSGNAQQLGSSVELITGDCKILNAFYLDSTIHYVFQSDYNNTSYTGINYNRLNVATLKNTTFTYGEIGYDCAYPSVASFALTPSDNTVVFCYLRSGVNIYPEVRAIVFDNEQKWSKSLLVKSGENYVDAFQLENTARWGDYTGIAYKYNKTRPEVWVSGGFGSNQTVFNTKYNCFNNWIGLITGIPLSSNDDENKNDNTIKLFPNPIIDLFSMEFEIPETSLITIEINDLNGVIVKTLYNGSLKSGKNMLTFNRNAISSGTYFVTVKTDYTIITTKKIVVN